MTLPKSIFFIAFLSIFTSCDGQISVGLNRNKGKVQKESDTLGEIVTEIGAGLITFYEDSKGNVWFGNDRLYRYDGKILTRFSEDEGLSRSRIMGIEEDRSGTIYINMDRSVFMFDGNHFEELKIRKGKTTTDWKLQHDDLWFMVDYGENLIYRCDGDWLYPLSFEKHPLENQYSDAFKNPSFSPYGVYYVLKDSHGHPWFGTSAAGAVRYNGELFTWLIEENLTEFDSGPAPGVRSILEDNDGHFWFSNDILHRYEIGETGYEVLEGIDISKTEGMPSFFMSIAQASNGDLWMTTYTEGVWSYNGKNLTHYPIQVGDRDIELYSIFADTKGGIWLGTHKEGVFTFNGEKFERFIPGSLN